MKYIHIVTRLTLILSAVIFCSCCKKEQQQQNNNSKNKIEVICHRGANRLAPENTFVASQIAIDNGADYIEIDLRRSKDGTYYNFHDKTLDRTTNGTGLFSETSDECLDTLDAGSWFGHEFKGERIPRFREYLKWIKGRAKVYIDIKEVNMEEIVSIVEEYSMHDQCFFNFSKIIDVEKYRQIAPNLQIKKNCSVPENVSSWVKKYNPQVNEIAPRQLTKELVDACHANGVKIMVHTPGDNWDDYRKVLAYDVDLIQVDNPGIFNNMKNNNGEFKEHKLIAHRGGIVQGLFNEFDPRSIQAAIDSGYYMLEIDVQETKDGVLIVHHDDNFKRFFNTNKKVSDLTWAEIKEMKSNKGNYHPLSFEEVAKMCSGKIKFMIDIKSSNPSSEFFNKIGIVMEEYNLLSNSYFIDKKARKYFWGKAKFEFRVKEAKEIKAKFDRGEDVVSNYFLFDHGNRLNAEVVKWCQKNNIEVIASINIGHYRSEYHLDGAHRDIEYWKKCGVTQFQIDSDYDKWLPNKY